MKRVDSSETAVVYVEAMEVKILVQKSISGVGLGGASCKDPSS